MNKNLSADDTFSITDTYVIFNSTAMKRIHVYVSCPMMLGDRETNLSRGIDMAQSLVEAGYCPFVPSLHFVWGDKYSNSYDMWLALDLSWILRCDALIYVDGPSRGVENEIRFAKEHGIPVFSSVKELDIWADSAGKNKAVFEYLETVEAYSLS